MAEGHHSTSCSRRELMNPAGYADHENYLWQLDQSALDRTEFLAEPQAHHQHLDVGCGTGGFTFRALEPLSRSAQRIVGVDVSPLDAGGSIAYELLDIASPAEVSAFVTKNGQFQRVYSFLCFPLVPDQRAAFRNIGDLMAADGECLVTSCVTNPALDAWLDIHTMPEWKRWVSKALCKSCHHKVDDAFLEQVTRLKVAGFTPDVVLSVTEGLLKDVRDPRRKEERRDPRVVFPSSIYFNYTGALSQIEEETRKCVVDAGLECIACEVIECTWLLRDVGLIFELYSDCFPVSAGLPSSDKEALKAAYIERLRPLVKETPRGCEMIVGIYRVHARPHHRSPTSTELCYAC
ncbi:hypothetical protein MTO96_020255 [Rhipicephalus appendiculatus]